MSVDSLKYDPIDYYKDVLKDKFDNNCNKYIDSLIKEGKIDISENINTTNLINKQKKLIDDYEKKLNSIKTKRGFLIFLAIVGVACIVLSVFLFFLYKLTPAFILIAVGILLTILSLYFIFKKLNKQIKEGEAQLKKLKNDLNNLLILAKNQLTPLFNLFTFKDFIKILNTTTSMFNLDEELDPKKLSLIKELYGFNESFSKDQSITDVMSGDVNTNPFIRCKILNMSMIDKTYTGTRVVSWTETYRDSEGNLRTRVESETLVATLVKKAPSYSPIDYLFYGNEAAPNLNFSRYPSGLKKEDNEDDINKIVKKEEKRLSKLTKKATKEGKTFQALGNSKFDALFGAYDRDNETQFRLLFTPLAQQNMVEIITAKEPYGDDFCFIKRNKINIISSLHGRDIFSYNPYSYFSYYSLDDIRKYFIQYMKELFSSLYFELAPILSIPLYQMTEGGKYNYNNNRHVSDYEAESFVNSMDLNLFKPLNSHTQQILKVSFNHSVNNTDLFNVDSYSFNEIPQVTSVSVMCRNGRSYLVDVPWFEYEPVNKTSMIGVQNCNRFKKVAFTSSNDLKNFDKFKNSMTRTKNFVGFYLDNDYNYNEQDDIDLNDYLDKKFSNFE